MASSSFTTPFPVSHHQLSLHIQGTKTDLIMSTYNDMIMVLVTQIGSMGTILHCRKEGNESMDPTFNVSVILGKRDESLLIACGRQLIESISSSGSSKSLLLSLGLKDHSLNFVPFQLQSLYLGTKLHKLATKTPTHVHCRMGSRIIHWKP